jgi:hypothetical protein
MHPCLLSRRSLALLPKFALLVSAALSQPSKPTGETTVLAEWERHLSEIKTLLSSDAGCPDRSSIELVEAAQFAANGPSVALIDYCQGGAYTDWILAVRLERGHPVLAHFRDAKRRPIDPEFLQGSSIMHATDVRLLPDRSAIMRVDIERDGNGKQANCISDAYAWNPESKTFDWDAQLSSKTCP